MTRLNTNQENLRKQADERSLRRAVARAADVFGRLEPELRA